MSTSSASEGAAIGTIPFELASHIFVLAVCHLRHEPRRYHDQLDILSRVSRSWKVIIDTTAELWSVMDSRHPERIAKLYLDKFQAHTLEVHLTDFSRLDEHEVDCVTALLLPQVDRIRTLDLDHYGQSSSLSPSLTALLEAALPRLASLSISRGDTGARRSITSYPLVETPNLQALHLQRITLEPRDLVMFPSLQELEVRDSKLCKAANIVSDPPSVYPKPNHVGLPRISKITLYRLDFVTVFMLLQTLPFRPATQFDITIAVHCAFYHPPNVSPTRDVLAWALSRGDANPNVTIELEDTVTRFRLPNTTLAISLVGGKRLADEGKATWYGLHSQLQDAYGTGPLTLVVRGSSTNSKVYWDQFDKTILQSRVEHIIIARNRDIWQKVGLWIMTPDLPSIVATDRHRWRFPKLRSLTYVPPEAHKEELGADLERLYEQLVRRGTIWDDVGSEARKIPLLSTIGTERLTPEVRAELQTKLESVVGKVVLG